MHGGILVTCVFTLWGRRSDSHHIEHVRRVIGVVTQVRQRMVHDGISIVRGIH